MALNSYLPERAGGMVAAGLCEAEDAAVEAVRALRAVGLRLQDVTVLADDAARARRVADAGGAWAPKRPRLALPFRRWLPPTIRSRYARPLAAGAFLVIGAADGQPHETLAAVLERAKASHVLTWWQEPAGIFAPAEEGGPL